MNAPRIILDSLPSLCQKLSHLAEVWRSYNKNNFACFFETRCSLNWYTAFVLIADETSSVQVACCLSLHEAEVFSAT